MRSLLVHLLHTELAIDEDSRAGVALRTAMKHMWQTHAPSDGGNPPLEQALHPGVVSRVQSLVNTEFEQFQKKAPAGAKSSAAPAKSAAAESGGAPAKRKRGGR